MCNYLILLRQIKILFNSTNQIQFSKEDKKNSSLKRGIIFAHSQKQSTFCPASGLVGSLIQLGVSEFTECLFRSITVMALLTHFILLGRQFT